MERWPVSSSHAVSCSPTAKTFAAHHIVPFTSNAHYPPHSHVGLTTHLVLDGELTLWYPNDVNREKVTYGEGSRVDVDAGRVHEVWMGSRGCTYVIGE